MPAVHSLEGFLTARMKDGQVSATTLVFTFFCDVVTQHGGEIWLGNVIRWLAPLGISERLIRTAVFRLVKDGWLESRKQGRRSYYRLTPTGENHYQRAAVRIYASDAPAWNGAWTLVLTSQVDDDKRDTLNRGLSWLGYGRLANSVFALPRCPHPALDEFLGDLDLVDSVVSMEARVENHESLRALLSVQWQLQGLQEEYRQFTGHYRHARNIIKEMEPLNGHYLLLLRIMLIHEYRKILLSDPELPATMLPENWPGKTARNLTAGLYRQLLAPTASWVNSNLPGQEVTGPVGRGTEKCRFPAPDKTPKQQTCNG